LWALICVSISKNAIFFFLTTILFPFFIFRRFRRVA
jgi:hypothetical protein